MHVWLLSATDGYWEAVAIILGVLATVCTALITRDRKASRDEKQGNGNGHAYFVEMRFKLDKIDRDICESKAELKEIKSMVAQQYSRVRRQRSDDAEN